MEDGTSIDDCFEAVAVGPDGYYILAGDAYAGPGEATTETGRVVSKFDVNGTEVWRYEDSNSRGNAVEALAVDQRDGSIVFAGNGLSPDAGTSSTHAGNAANFAVVKLDTEGNILWQYEDDTGDLDSYAFGIAMAEDGSVVVVGHTRGDWDMDNAGEEDFAAFRLDANGTEIWRYQDGSGTADELRSAAMVDEDTSVVVAGYTYDDEGDPYFVAIKLHASNGTEIWRYEDVTTSSRFCNGATATEDGGVVLAGSAAGSTELVSTDDSDDYADFLAVKLDAEGVELWRYQDGTVYADWFDAVLVQEDGSLLFLGSTEGSWGGDNNGDGFGSTEDMVLTSLSAEGEERWRWQAGSAQEDEMTTMVGGSDGRVLVAGCTAGSWEQPNSGGKDSVALMLSTGTMQTPSPSLASGTPAFPSPTSAGSSPAPSLASPAGNAAPNVTPTPTVAISPALPYTSSAPFHNVFASTPAPLAGGEKQSDNTLIIAGVGSAVGAAMLVALGAWGWRHLTTKKRVMTQPDPPTSRDFDDQLGSQQRPDSRPHSIVSAGGIALEGEVMAPPRHRNALIGAERFNGGGIGSTAVPTGDEPILPQNATSSSASATQIPRELARPVRTTHACRALSIQGGNDEGARRVFDRRTVKTSLTTTTSTDTIPPVDRVELDQYNPRLRVATTDSAVAISSPGDVDYFEALPSARRRGSPEGIGLGEAVMAAAGQLAMNCHVPGVSEAATALSILANMVSDGRHSESNAKLRQCRSIVRVLERAAEVAEKDGGTMEVAERLLIEDVQYAISDLVELIKIYQSKDKLSKVLVSTQFKRRRNELDVAVNQAMMRLQLGLQVQVRHDLGAVKDGINLYQKITEAANHESLAEARRQRRQRKLDALEIPDDQVEVSDELLGRGGFGEVFIARVYERNAAAKVVRIDQDIDQRGDSDVLAGQMGGRVKLGREVQKKVILRELEAMIRLRSPHTVNVYGAVTSLPDRLILVMELLVGGDLRALLKRSEHALPEQQARQIIGDICAGMMFLHSKGTVHGDLKSANVLFDGAGRAKIGDFGTSRWASHTKSTGFATYTKSPNTQISLAWSAPEVLRATGCTYASDVYSFGIVVWEVLTRELPWANLPNHDHVYIHVVLNMLRPDIPDEAPADLADMMRACWVVEPEARPAFKSIMKSLKSRG